MASDIDTAGVSCRDELGWRAGISRVDESSAATVTNREVAPDGASADAALEELRVTGQPGQHCVILLRRLGRQCVKRRSFPPPEGYDTWSQDAVDDLLADMFAREGRGRRFVINCYVKATDGASLERLLLTAIENFLKDQAKATERGKLRRRLENMLDIDHRFVRCAGSRWALSSAASRVWQGDIAQLEAAAWAVRGVSITRWNTSGPTPTATRDALLVITLAVLEAADGGVRAEDLARVLQSRFGLLRPAAFVALDADDGWAGDQEIAVAAEETCESVDARVRELWHELTAGERRLVPLLADGPDRWARELGTGTETAAAAGEALKIKLRTATVDDADCDRVVIGLLDLVAGNALSG
jgi:hypothetical protein